MMSTSKEKAVVFQIKEYELIERKRKADNGLKQIEQIISNYGSLDIGTINSVDEFKKLLSDPENFVRDAVASKKYSGTVSDIGIDYLKFKELVSIPDLSSLKGSIETYHKVKNNISSLNDFDIKESKVSLNADYEKSLETYYVKAKTDSQKSRLEKCNKFIDSINEIAKDFYDIKKPHLVLQGIIKYEYGKFVPDASYVLRD